MCARGEWVMAPNAHLKTKSKRGEKIQQNSPKLGHSGNKKDPDREFPSQLPPVLLLRE